MRLAALLMSMLWLWSCSGGGGNELGPSIIDRSGRNVGTITGFGSVIVNEVEYATNTATITIDDTPGMESNLLVGQIVVVDGLVDAGGTTGTADAISTDPSIRGPIEQIDLANNRIDLLGSIVGVTGNTLFGPGVSPAAIESLSIGERIEVHGFATASGEISATLITRSADSELEVRGRVSSLNTNASTFQINDLVVDFTGATLVGFMGDIANGDLVEVEGSSRTPQGHLLAARVEFESGTRFTADDAGTELELEGIITRFTDATDFDVSGVAIITNASTEFEGGASADLQLNARIEVEGEIDPQGRLVAEEVEFLVESNLVAEAVVESVSVEAPSLTLLGLEAHISNQTQFIDESDAALQNFALGDIALGDYIKLKAFADSNGLTATLVKRKNPEDKLKLSGVVTTISEPDIFVATAQIATNAATSFEINDEEVSSTVFFNALGIGDRLEVEGQSSTPGILDADSVELDQ